MRLVRPRWPAAVAAVVLVVAVALYVVRARSVHRELREGRAAYDAVCERITTSGRAAGSPGSIAHLVAALQAEMAVLAERHPRWHRAYLKDPGAYPCGPPAPNTQVGSDR